MDSKEIDADSFASLLKKQDSKKLSLIYKNEGKVPKTGTLNNSKEIFSDISKQIKLMHNDRVKSNYNKDIVKKMNNMQLLPFNKLQEIQKITTVQSSKQFETQCVSDTQLIHMIEQAESDHSTNKIAQDFNNTFHYNSIHNDNNVKLLIELSDKVNKTDDPSINDKITMKAPISNVEANSVCNFHSPNIVNSIVDKNTYSNEDGNDTLVLSPNMNCLQPLASPIINAKKVKRKSRTLSPLVYNLNDFENFEKVAVPIIGVNKDLSTAKHLINSQIIDKELLIHNYTNNINNKDQLSPILHKECSSTASISKITLLENLKDTTEKSSFILKDEMLFSSDEEDDYISKKSFDLPLTCALETSFYDQPDALDNTMYVAFQTASNKSIEITTESFNKAQTVYKNINSDVTTNSSVKLTNLSSPKNSKTEMDCILKTEMCKIKNIELIEFKESNAQTAVTQYKSRNNMCSKLNESAADVSENFKGFKTASDKSIKLSEQAFLRCKRVFKDIDYEENFEFPIDKVPNANETQVNSMYRHEETSGPYNVGDNVIVEEFESNILHENNNISNKEIPSIIGFKTASNKNIVVSEASFAKTKGVFQDIDIKENIQNNLQINYLAENIEIKNIDKFVGFKTANNKNIIISELAKAKAKNIFQDIQDTETSPSSLNISKDIAHVIKKITKEECVSNVSVSQNNENCLLKNIKIPSTTFVGFKTANNKTINICKEALAKTKNIFETNENANQIESQFVAFKTGNKMTDAISKEALAKSKTIYDNSKISRDVNICSSKKSMNPFEDFKLPKSKLMQISYDVSNTANLKSNDNHKPSLSKQIKGLKTTNITNQRCTNTQSSEMEFQGFKTASNKDIKISEQALFESKRLLEDNLDIDLFSNNKSNLYVDQIMHCFQTTSNKPLKISSQALEKNIQVYQTTDNLCASDKNDFLNTSNKGKSPSFVGFKTASNKRVNISEEAIIQTKKVFDNIDNFCGFKTAADKKIDIHENALLKARLLLQDVDKKVSKSEDELNKCKDQENFKSFINLDDKNCLENNKFCKSIKSLDLNPQNIIDTQVINNFEFTLNTEDFYKDETPKSMKRAGSPILSCPKAKKRRKFETPFKSDYGKVDCVINYPVINENNEKDKNILQCKSYYKKSKKYKLRDVNIMEKCCANKVINTYNLSFNFEHLLQFEFLDERNDISSEKLTIDELKDLFLNTVNNKIIPDGWLDNHLRLILWKLISYEIKFPNVLHAVCSASNVLDQLRYRYNKELYNVERSALRKILEKDDVATKVLVLCVVGIYVNGNKVNSVTNPTDTIELLLTDGWYCIKACIDSMLAKVVYDEKIVVGGKIVTHGAELINCEQGISPWEDTSAVRLKLFGNSTRRARWDTRLGYHSKAAMLTQLSSVKLDGGKVSKLRVFVTRVYPPLYVEKFEDGSTVTRSERLEHMYQMKYESERQLLMEKIYEDVEKEFFEKEQESNSSTASGKRKCVSNKESSKISKYLDHSDIKSQITSSQVARIEAQTNKQREKWISELQSRFQDRLNSLDGRKVVALMKIRVVGVDSDKGVSKGMLSIWRPNEAIADILKENSWIEVYNVVPTAYKYSELQMSASGQSIFIQSKFKENVQIKSRLKALRRTCSNIKDLVKNPTLNTEYNEIDTVGIIFHIEPSTKDFEISKNQQFQNVYFSDADKNLICVNFWGGLAKFGYQNVLDTGQFYACVNLQKRAGNTKKNIPHYRATEFSYFTKTPKHEETRLLIDELVKQFSGIDRRKFFEECLVLKNNYTVNKKQTNENISPYRFNNYNLSNMYISPKYSKVSEEIFNLNGLDFESTFKQNTQELSPKVLMRKKQVNDKIAKLKMYGEPPPLSPIQIINKTTNATNSYKSPLSKCDISHSISNVEKSVNDESPIQSSPVLNITYVKRGVNPVKLNFSNAHDDLDNFAEEFDGSPPLSLDSNDCI